MLIQQAEFVEVSVCRLIPAEAKPSKVGALLQQGLPSSARTLALASLAALYALAHSKALLLQQAAHLPCTLASP